MERILYTTKNDYYGSFDASLIDAAIQTARLKLGGEWRFDGSDFLMIVDDDQTLRERRPDFYWITRTPSRASVKEFRNAFLENFIDKYYPMPTEDARVPDDKIEHFLQQYYAFCHNAIQMLLTASINAYKWPILKEEIVENILEELGKFTEGVPHLQMMKQGYSELQIPSNFSSDNATSEMMNNLFAIFNDDNTSRLAGALVAFETLAIREYFAIEFYVRKLAEIKGLRIDENGTLMKYIKGHQTFEVEHSDHLAEAVDKCYAIHEVDQDSFEDGFAAVVHQLSTWWKSYLN